MFLKSLLKFISFIVEKQPAFQHLLFIANTVTTIIPHALAYLRVTWFCYLCFVLLHSRELLSSRGRPSSSVSPSSVDSIIFPETVKWIDTKFW